MTKFTLQKAESPTGKTLNFYALTLMEFGVKPGGKIPDLKTLTQMMKHSFELTKQEAKEKLQRADLLIQK